ncbi:tandem-95 repeat protein, partial [Vibrio parahaemolyticus]|nr:tandem-95 repeat protein [Vibrio parahaemolyticus]
PASATLTQQPDGMYHLVTTQDFNGLVELGYTATDGEEVVEGSLNVDVIPVNDAPFNVGNAFMATDEDGAFTFDAGDLMNLFGDIDTENLVVSRIITAEGEDGGEVTDNGDGTWSFTPAENFNGDVPMSFGVSDGDLVTPVEGNLNIEAVNDAPEAPTIQMQGEEDVVMVIDPAYIADQVTDLDGDEISVESITVRAPANATLTQQPDGM